MPEASGHPEHSGDNMEVDPSTNGQSFNLETTDDHQCLAVQEDEATPLELNVDDGVILPVNSCGISDMPVGVFRFSSDHPLHDMHIVHVIAPQLRLVPNFLGASPDAVGSMYRLWTAVQNGFA